MSDTESKPQLPTLADIESGKVTVVLPEKKKRVAKRFTSKKQIEDRIDKFTKKANLRRDQQRQCYADANQIRRTCQGDVDNIHKLAKKEAEGDRRGKQADRLEKDVLPKLKAKLAEFNTATIPGIMDDQSVPGI